MTSTIIPTKDVAALLRKELRTTFPGVKFSVRCSTGTAAAWIDVAYDDGPSIRQIHNIVSKYEGRSLWGIPESITDRATALVAGKPGEMPTEVQYAVDGINTSRTFTAAGNLAAQRIIRESSNMPHLILCNDAGELVEDHDITGGRGWEFNDGEWGWGQPTLSPQAAVRFLLQHTDLTPTPAHA